MQELVPNEMESSDWERYNFELARALGTDASRTIANDNTSLRQKTRAMELVLGFQWTKKSIKAAGAAKISGLAQRGSRLSCTKDLAKNGGLGYISFGLLHRNSGWSSRIHGGT